MADQAQMTSTNGPARDGRTAPATTRAPAVSASEPGATAVVSGIAGFGENLLNLAELQARLAAIELRQNAQAMQSSAGILWGGSMLATASLVVALAGIAEVCVSEWAIRRGIAFLTVGALGLVLAIACAAIAIANLRRNTTGFPLSGEEFARNLQWIRTVLRHSGRVSPRR
jgi:Putative Actinobacterial Holin-X, holin superfamily III